LKKYNDVKNNEAYPTNSIVVVIENYLQLSFTPLGMETTCGCTSTSNNVKVFELKQQARLKQKKLD
jgi:hypothetical protein